MFGGRIHWRLKKDVPNSLKQTAYHNVSMSEVPFTYDGEITEAVIIAIKVNWELVPHAKIDRDIFLPMILNYIY